MDGKDMLAARLAAELRDNLRKRKERARGTSVIDPPPPPDDRDDK